MESICHTLRRDIRQLNSSMVPISIIPPSSTSTTDLNQLDQSFMYTQLLKENLLDMQYNDTAKHEFADFYRAHYAKSDNELKKLREFEQEYDPSKVIWWYSKENFIYQLLNGALRTQNTEIIVRMGFVLRDVHLQIEHLHLEASNCNHFHVYRGQGMSYLEFEKMKNNKGGLLSFNNFLSTSIFSIVPYAFAESALGNPDQVGILFQINIDPSTSMTPFASLDSDSYFKDGEKEILFSMHTIFRIGDIEPIKDRVWAVNLTLTSDSDQELAQLTEYFRKNIEGATSLHRICSLTTMMAEWQTAEVINKALFKTTSNNNLEQITFLNTNLGQINFLKGNYPTSLSYHEKTLQLQQTSLPSNHPSLASTYSNIGLMHKSMGEYSKATSSYEKALEIQQKSLPSNHPDLASTYTSIGVMHKFMGEYSKALSYYEKALEIQQKSLPSNHPDLATTYNTITSVHETMGEYAKAQTAYEKAREITEKPLPSNPPSLANTYNNIGMVHLSMGEHSKALSYYEKTLEIQQTSLPYNHPSLATTCSNIAAVHESTGEYSKALSYYERAFEIQQTSLSSNHPSLATTYNNMGMLHFSMVEYPKALSSYEKAIEIW
ncbi:unnamed protein product [Rotaria magnacalcarata]|nr:unnamed protein product [Rotaria magnacalcarata]